VPETPSRARGVYDAWRKRNRTEEVKMDAEEHAGWMAMREKIGRLEAELEKSARQIERLEEKIAGLKLKLMGMGDADGMLLGSAPPVERLLVLADYLDALDARNGVTEHEVQDDLRRWASGIARARIRAGRVEG
jgi:hypothetical protein